MKAEEKLKELYEIETVKPPKYKLKSIDREVEVEPTLFVTNTGRVHISPEDIDLIANLVGERLRLFPDIDEEVKQ